MHLRIKKEKVGDIIMDINMYESAHNINGSGNPFLGGLHLGTSEREQGLHFYIYVFVYLGLALLYVQGSECM